MASNQNYESLLNESINMYASGYDNTYIEFQFAGKGIDDSMIDKIIADINMRRRLIKKDQGLKLIIWGASFIAAALLMTFFISHFQFSKTFAIYGSYILGGGLAISGVSLMIKGLSDISGL